MSRRCIPSECPRHTVTAVVTRKSASALQLKKIGPPTSAVTVMAESHKDFFGAHLTVPSTAFVSSASNMRGERNVLADVASASSIGSESDWDWDWDWDIGEASMFIASSATTPSLYN